MNLPSDLEQQVTKLGAVVHLRYPWWLRPLLMRGVTGITLGKWVYIEGAEVERVLRHELVHVRQIAQLGILRFYGSYLREYLANRRRGLTSAQAYQQISLEIEAFAAESEETL